MTMVLEVQLTHNMNVAFVSNNNLRLRLEGEDKNSDQHLLAALDAATLEPVGRFASQRMVSRRLMFTHGAVHFGLQSGISRGCGPGDHLADMTKEFKQQRGWEGLEISRLGQLWQQSFWGRYM